MGRKKVYYDHELPRGVVAIAVAVISDYERRKKEIERGTLCKPLLLTYKRYNDIVERAIVNVEENAREEFISDISHGRGYRYSLLNAYYTSRSYYARKSLIIFKVAAEMGLTLEKINVCQKD